MLGSRCQRRRKVLDVGLNTKFPISWVPDNFVLKKQHNSETKRLTPLTRGIDLFSQACKVLSERNPFDTEDARDFNAFNLPRELASFLSKHSDGRKRHKRPYSGAEAKSSRPEKASGSSIWVETEEYFRQLAFVDIKKLHELSSFRFLDTRHYFLIPFLGNGKGYNAEKYGNVVALDNGLVRVELKEEHEQYMYIDNAGGSELPQEEKICSLSQQVSGIEWLLGSRSKVFLTTERPSKKRKLLGVDAGLQKLFVSKATEESSFLCHYCSLGDTGDQLNRLIVCHSCNVAVHQRCYGVQDDIAGPWLCSWCKHRGETQNSERPCLLCPKKGGALKPVRKRGYGSDNDESMGFSHLFCCQWMPEVYIEDTRTMEPIINVEEIKEVRRKLVCCLCKVKCGACVRCSHGACRASFHPICAREARHRMEIWGKFGCDDVELRAFCSKHSEVQSNSTNRQVVNQTVPIVGSDSSIMEHQLLSLTANTQHKIKSGRRNGDTVTVCIDTSDKNLDKVGSSLFHEDGLLDARSNSKLLTECGDMRQSICKDSIDKQSGEDINTTNSNSMLILKKLIDQGKVYVNDVASEIGVSPDFLTTDFMDDCLESDLHCKIVEWLRNNAYIGSLQRNLKVKFKSSNLSKDEMAVSNESNIEVPDARTPDVISAMSVAPRRRTKSNIRILKDNKMLCLPKASINHDGIAMDNKSDHLVGDEPHYQCKESVPDVADKNLLENAEVQDTSTRNSSKIEGAESLNCSNIEGGQVEEVSMYERNTAVDSSFVNHLCSVDMNYIPDRIKVEAFSRAYIHPSIQKTLLQMQNGVVSEMITSEDGGLRHKEVSALEACSSSSFKCNLQSQNLTSEELIFNDGVNLEHLAKARIGILEQSPEDEVEEELIFCQHRLLYNEVATKRFGDNLISKVLKNLQQEIDAVGKQNWDALLVNRYICELREAKKQGRKERRHKEAQAVLAAATAAAAASSRISSIRKDSLDESGHLEINMLKVNPSSGRAGLYSQQMPRAKETISRLSSVRISSEKNSDIVQPTSNFSTEHSRNCGVCQRSDSILNPILVCSSCKVAVHLDCYRSIKYSTGPWRCELCEELLSSRSFGAPGVNSREKPYSVAECGLCCGTTGAFRKSTHGQWIHAFCAEWVLESTFRRGQENSIEGMEKLSLGDDMCHICHRKQGVCIKCNYGHCQSTFHPFCASSGGLYMNTRTSGGKLQHKAYCEKHSVVERAKVGTQKHGIEELKSLKPVRVELEKLRLLCERIIKREKLKRELVLCSHDILEANRESVALAALVCSSSFSSDVSSESATTSLKDYMGSYKSGSEGLQRSDDITVDSTVAGKQRVKFAMLMDNDQKTDASSTSQQLFTPKPTEMASISGKQIPHRSSSVASWSSSRGGEKQSKHRKHTETFEKELVMTSDQASMRNQRLPKGFVYVPIRRLSNEKETVPDACSQLKRDG